MVQPLVAEEMIRSAETETGLTDWGLSDGSIIFITSAGGLVSQPDIMSYSVSKAGENHLARCLAKELAPFNIRVTAIALGLIRSEASRPI